AGDTLSNSGEKWLWQYSKCPAVHVAAASAGGRGTQCPGKPQFSETASRVAQGSAEECRGNPCASQGPAQSGASEPRTAQYSLSRRRLRDKAAGAAWQLRECGREHHLAG